MCRHPKSKIVSSYEDLADDHDWNLTPLVIYPRTLEGDFNGLANILGEKIPENYSGGRVMAPIDNELMNSFERTFEKVESFLTSAQILAFEKIKEDCEAAKEFYPQVRIEKAWEKTGTSKWHPDRGFKQGRLLCAYNTMAMQVRLGQDVIDIPIHALTRHSVINPYTRRVKSLKHRRHPMRSSEYQGQYRLLLNSAAVA